jgi:hypothetical protein
MIDLQSILDHISVHSLLECHSHTLIMFGYTITFLNRKLNSTMHNHYIYYIIQQGVYKLVPRSLASIPAGQKLLQGKPVFKLKQDENNTPTRFKARWVVKGYEQIPGLDFTATTSPTARLESFCIILNIAACLGWDLQQFDVKTAFLHGELEEGKHCWMEQPRC